MGKLARSVVRAQGAYYIASGAFPFVSMRLFERVTGPKVDRWLVQMVGLMAMSIGVSLLAGTHKKRVKRPTLTLAVTSALSFAGIDIVHVARKRISPIYLADAAAELAILTLLARSAKC
jgi:hypothetical protein